MRLFQKITLAVFLIIILLTIIIGSISYSTYLLIAYTAICIIFIFCILIKIINDLSEFKNKNKIIIFNFFSIVLVITVILSLYTSKKIEISLKENEKIDISNVYDKMKIKKKSDKILKLENFIIERYKTKNKEIKSYTSYVSIISSNNKIEKKTIKVNKPLKLDKIKFYQKSWKLSIKEIILKFENKNYDFIKQKNEPILTNDNLLFNIYPVDLINDKLLYEWVITDNNKKIVKSGRFINLEDDKNQLPERKYNFSIIIEDYKPITVLEATYKPLNILLSISSILFLISLYIFCFYELKKENNDNF